MKLKQIRVDGYKNLINCVLDLGDFNVLVGPNNSGKSNLLEAIQMLWPICFGDEKLREKIFKGLTPSSRFGFSMSHLNKYANKPITIGVCFEVQVEGNLWVADYEVKVQCAYEKKDNRGFIHETLKAKRPNRPGPAIEYISRDEEKFKVHGATYEISKSNPSLQAVRSIYPDFKGLPTEFLAFYTAIGLIGLTRIFAFSPKGLRNDIGSENDIESTACTCVSSFDLTLLADKIKEEGKLYNLFVQSLCHILDLEQVELEVEDVKPGKEKGKDVSKRMRFFFMQRCGDCYALINEYSDGTLVVVGILEALFCEESRGIILCIEELENCLHPAAVGRLLRFLQDHSDKWPVVITTHSPYLLNGINPEDVNVAIVDETGAAHFEKVKSTKRLRDYLKSGLWSLGDLLPSNFEEVLRKK